MGFEKQMCAYFLDFSILCPLYYKQLGKPDEFLLMRKILFIVASYE